MFPLSARCVGCPRAAASLYSARDPVKPVNYLFPQQRTPQRLFSVSSFHQHQSISSLSSSSINIAVSFCPFRILHHPTCIGLHQRSYAAMPPSPRHCRCTCPRSSRRPQRQTSAPSTSCYRPTRTLQNMQSRRNCGQHRWPKLPGKRLKSLMSPSCCVRIPRQPAYQNMVACWYR